MSGAAVSAHVCTRPGAYAHAILDLSAFADTMPCDPAAGSDDATFWAITARAYMAELQAACTLARQLRAGGKLPVSLGRTLISMERILRGKVRDSITDHERSKGTEAAQLLVELNAISVVTAPRGAA